MSTDNNWTFEDCIIEFDIIDLTYNTCSVLPDSKHSESRESLVYTVFRTQNCPEPIGQLTEQVVFNHYRLKLNDLVWRLGELCQAKTYWMLFHEHEAVIKEMESDAIVAREVSHPYDWIPKGTGGAALAELNYRGDLHLSEWAGCSHAAGFHLFALPQGSESNEYFEELLRAPAQHIREIGDMCWDSNLILCDSAFEIRPFGDEDRDHLEIVMPKSLSRESLRSIIMDIYGLQYSIASCTPAEFGHWEDNHSLEDLHWVSRDNTAS